MTRVGFIGLGSQGGPMARRIVDEGYPLTIWARRAASAEPFADTAAKVARTPAELGEASDVVGICVVADADVEDVLLRPDGVLAGMAPGGLVAIHSTIHPDTCRRLAEAAGERGVAVIDAPVSGGGGAAAARGLLVMAGGAAEDVERARPVLETFANPLLHLGPLGSGQLAKLLNNFVFTAQVGLALDTFAFADRLGIDRAAAAAVLAGGSGGSRAAAILAASGFDTTGLRGAAALLEKDVRITLEVADAQSAAAPRALADLARGTLTTLTNPPPAVG
ncbi:NAD(P)-dependent oxidoreductase [Frankia sp. CNm7]|uniref:NAD(P)-dependent oxidoreductase n=1 Tax=Frankia nepalensis TaxID=1836974 RepID=A0A937RBE8_9ACTN|nr:NAD(P)-dependent oxidoreductase [Frankia nepalensis]MBL7501269.1 NAD(P)-dependent oxidoreductase [Frankia nepalensis]MBL7510116.1 NAD(P)-dependent oxidoreductase [Frankia nepalensis]MBL7523855.1 NAD(P)-dependent oxidoreductase [Frankia nepalensis]MBL7627350.1 NAD(P)-dependent oxidoreductase [Frankia nepalensis]